MYALVEIVMDPKGGFVPVGRFRKGWWDAFGAVTKRALVHSLSLRTMGRLLGYRRAGTTAR